MIARRITLIRRAAAVALIGISIAACDSGEPQVQAQPLASPNILIILADDMGYTDLGAFGGEDISTPNLDQLAFDGLRFSNFHAAPSCAPTRSMLMTGTGNHEAGLGTQIMYPEFRDAGPEYTGQLSPDLVTLPEAMRDAGYFTLMSGKWHLSAGSANSANFAVNRGFDRSFTLLEGGDHHFGTIFNDVSAYTQDGELVDRPAAIYSTTLYVNKLIEFLDSRESSQQPFFAYFAPTAPHWPIQPPPDWIDRYAGAYEGGYEQLCLQRMDGARAAGVLPQDFVASHCPLESAPWGQLSAEDQSAFSRVMELYAAMVEHLDQEIGRLLDYLDEQGLLDNTLILFLNDNGPQGVSPLGGYTARLLSDLQVEDIDNSYDNLGRDGSWPNIGQGWADGSSAPYRGTKGSQYEGGTRVPAFVWSAANLRDKTIDDQFLHVMDVMPTLMDIAGADKDGLVQLRGESFYPLLQNQDTQVHLWQDPIILDSAGASVIFYNRYKIVRPLYGEWEFYDLRIDPMELNNVIDQYPDMVTRLLANYESVSQERNYVQRVAP